MIILPSQRDRALALLAERGMMRLSELKASGITAATVKRMEEQGVVARRSRGLYQRPDAPLQHMPFQRELVERRCLINLPRSHRRYEASEWRDAALVGRL